MGKLPRRTPLSRLPIRMARGDGDDVGMVGRGRDPEINFADLLLPEMPYRPADGG